MVIKVLFLCTEWDYDKASTKIGIAATDIDVFLPTLHDFDVILIDNEELNDFIRTNSWKSNQQRRGSINRANLGTKTIEAVRSGVIVYIFPSSYQHRQLFKAYNSDFNTPYDWLPFNLKIKFNSGDTARIISENVSEYKPLFDDHTIEDIEWNHYFTEYPDDSKTIVTNRAGHPIFMEVPFGKGKFVFLPLFVRKSLVIECIVNKVAPSIIQNNYQYDIPKWVKEYSHPIEERTRQILSDFRNAKQIIYTNDRGTEKASALILETLGFSVKRLPAGTLPDLELINKEQTAIVEVKGHQNRRADRPNIAQILTYETETEEDVKLIMISNHEFYKPLDERSEKAYTQGAIGLAVTNNISLLNSVDLWKLYLHQKEGHFSDQELETIREKIMNGKGIVTFDEFYCT